MQKLLLTALTLSLVLFAACSAGSTTEDELPAPAKSQLAAFALGYDAGRDASERAIASAQEAVRNQPDDATRYVALAESFLVRRRETANAVYQAYAKDAVAAAMSLAPTDARVLVTQVLLLMDDHAFAEAARVARKAIAADASSATGYLLLSDARLELGDYPGAIEALQNAMDRQPDLRTYSRTAHLRWLHGDVDGALEAMDDAIASGATAAEPIAWCYVDLGTMLWHRGELDIAQRAAQRALDLVSDYTPALSLEARLLAARGDVAGAIARLERVVSRAPTAEELLRLAELHATVDAARAAELVTQAEKLAQHDPLPLVLYYTRHRANQDRALALAETALAERRTVYTHDAHAMSLLRRGRVSEASAEMAKALALETPDARLLLHRGLVELAAGDRSAADASLRQARELNPYADSRLADELSRELANPTANQVKAL